MTDFSVAIVKSDFHGRHTGSWSNEWLEMCKEQGIEHELVDWRQSEAFVKLCKHRVVLWHFSHYSNEEMKFARGILASLKEFGCLVFPDYSDNHHFDDKVTQAYLLEGLSLPTPKNYPLHSMSAVEDWVEKIGTFPIVAKLKAGSGASNVVLIKTQQQLYRYAKRMFGRGYSGKPSAFFKIKSNVSSSRTLDDFISRFKRAPEFIFSRMYAASREREHGYVYLQEFIPNVDYDLKVVVIGDKLSFIGRSVRKDDFRASGGGDLFYNRDLMTEELIKTAFHAADALQSDCIGLDMISNPITFKPLILEISYGFSHTALLAANGHYDRNAVWHEEPLNAPRALLDMLIRKLRLL